MRQKIQIVLIVAFVVAAVRVGYIFYERHEDKQATAQPKPEADSLNRDYYVTPKKLYPSDVKSARQLTQQPVWVREGYRYAYYPYDAAAKRTDFSKEAGQLRPLQKLQVNDVVTDRTPGDPSQKQIMAVFPENGRSYAVSIGTTQGSHTLIYSDEMFYIQNPRELYAHWPTDVWQAIENHEVKPGMSELQVNFAIGFGIPEDAHSAMDRTVHYSNGGKPVVVTYRGGKAIEVKQS